MKVSVVISCRDGEPHLAQAVASVLAQPARPVEVVLVADRGARIPSSVVTADGVDRANTTTVPVRLLRLDWISVGHARNIGCERTVGDAVLFLDPGDVLGPGVLAATGSALAERPNAVAVGTWAHLERDLTGRVARYTSASTPRTDDDHLGCWWRGRDYPASAQLWSRHAWRLVGGWDERTVANAGADMLMRAVLEGVAIQAVVGADVYCRRSGTRPMGEPMSRGVVESALYVRVKLAFMLRDRNRLAPYREAVTAEFERLAEACASTYPDLAVRCREYARRFGQRRNQPPSGIAAALSRRARRPSSHVPSPDTAAQALRPDGPFHGDETARHTASVTGSIPEALAEAPRAKVSVIVPTYNRAHLIARAIDSVLAQTFEDFELLIVDDGSTDETARVVQRYAQRDARVRYVSQQPNRGVAAARNLGMRDSVGELIAFLDSDDQWFPHKLARQVDLLAASPPDVGLVYCGVENVNERGERWCFEPRHRGDVYAALLMKNIVHSGSGVVLRRNVVRTAGFFDEDIPAIEDYDYWLRIARSYRFDYVTEPLLRYSDASGTARKSNDVQANMNAREWFFRKYEAEMRWAGVAHRFLLTSARWHVVPWYANYWGARRLALRAVLINPRAWDAWHFLVRHSTPEPLRQLARPLRRAARELFRLKPAAR